MSEYTVNDFKKGRPRWCPGCGDHFFLASLHKAMAKLGPIMSTHTACTPFTDALRLWQLA